jgi:voltage-gated potassium channel
MKQKIKKIVLDADTFGGKFFDLFIQSLIILSLISFSIETLPNLNEQILQYLWYFNVFCIVIFTAEYLLRIYLSDKKLSFIFSFYGIIDFFAFAPFYITSGIDLRSIRIFRIFRLLRVFKILRYNKAINRFKDAIVLIKEELILFLFVTLLLLYISAVGIYYFENAAQPEAFKSIFHSFWWAIVTLTTVGYGDVYPITLGGKIFTSIIVLIGLGIVAVPTGLIASALTRTIKDNEL